MNRDTYSAIRWFYIIAISLAGGAVANLILFLSCAFLFAGANGGIWMRWYFEVGEGKLFMGVTALLAVPIITRVKKLKIV